MPIELEWDITYSVNNPELDTQHQRIFRIVNSLPDQFDDHQARQIVLRLFTHARDHFGDEELMMKDIGYPHLDNHKQLHGELLEQLSKIATTNFPDQQSLDEFKKFVSNWLSNHFLTEDMDYVTFYRKRKKN